MNWKNFWINISFCKLKNLIQRDISRLNQLLIKISSEFLCISAGFWAWEGEGVRKIQNFMKTPILNIFGTKKLVASLPISIFHIDTSPNYNWSELKMLPPSTNRRRMSKRREEWAKLIQTYAGTMSLKEPA